MNVDQELCIGCGACSAGCPVEALQFNDDGKMECNKDVCIQCGACLGTCPVEAIAED